MRLLRVKQIAIVALAVAWVPGSTAEDQTLHFVETASTLELTVPAGGVWLVMPLAGYERIRPQTSGAPGPRSFNVVNREAQVEIFGAFDSASAYPGFRQYWAETQEAMKLEEAPEPHDIELAREGEWQIVIFDTQRGEIRSSHVVGELVKDQVWIDVQVRATGSEETSVLRDVALEAFRGLSVRMD